MAIPTPINKLFTDSSLIAEPSKDAILNARAEAGAFADDGRTVESFQTPSAGLGMISDTIQAMRNIEGQNRIEQAAIIQRRQDSQLAEQKRRELEERARLKAGEKDRKQLYYNADGSLKQDSDLELRAKQFVNGGLDLWNKANDFIPDFLVKDKTLDIDGRLTGTIAGMTHEDLSNKSFFAARDMSKKQVLDQVNSLQDDSNGKGTLYYLRKEDGVDENGNVKYLYKPGFAQLNAADRYRSQAVAAGWEIVKEVQSSGSAETEKLIQAKFIGDRTLSYDQVKGKDGKYISRDKASGIDFGSGYGEIYNKDILGWDKKPTKGEVSKYKVGALKQAMASGITGDQLKAYRATLDGLTPDALHQIQLDDNKARSYAKRDERDIYKSTHYNDDAWSSTKAGLNKVGRELLDTGLDAITVSGMDRTSSLGNWLGADGQGNSERLDQWKSQDAADKYIGYDRKQADEFANSFAYHTKKGDYTGALGALFSQGGLNMTAESLGYMAPTLVGAIIATPFTGGASDVAAAVGIGSKIKTALGVATEAKSALNAAQVAGRTAEVATQAEKITAANAIINSGARELGSKITSAAMFAKNAGFYSQAAAMTNERIDERIKNNGGQPTSMFENAAVFAESVVENYIDRAVDLAVLGAAGHKEIQAVYGLLDKAAKAHIAIKIASKAVALSASAGVEGATEYVQAVGQSLSEQYDTKKNGGTVAGILGSKENQEEYLTNFLMGAAAGVHMQAVPSGLGVAKDLVGAAVYKYGGGKTSDEQLARYNELSAQIANGTIDPHNQPISVRDDKGLTAVADIHEAVTQGNKLPEKIAAAAIRQTFNSEALMTSDDGTITDPASIIANVDKSLRTTFKIDERGMADTAEMQAKYEHTVYQHAMSTIRQVVKLKDSTNKTLLAQGIVVDDAATGKAIENVMAAYGKVLPSHIMSQVQMMTASAVMKNLQENSIETADKGTALGDIVHAGKDGAYSIDVTKLESAARNLNAIIMGSDPTGGRGTGGGSGTDSAFKAKETLAAITNMKSYIETAIKSSKVENGKVKLSGDFFDQSKNAKIVGSEILLTGKTDDESGSKFGKGIYEHAEDVLDDIVAASSADGTNTKISEESINSWLSFALGRVKVNSVANLPKDGYYSKSDIWKTQGSKSLYKANYIPEFDRTGSTAKQKMLESDHMINAANQVKTALEMTSRIDEGSKSKMLESVNKIISKSEQDKVELAGWVKEIEENGHNKDVVLNDLRGSLKYWTTGKGKDSKYAETNIADANARIAEAIDSSGGRFNESTPIYAFEDNFAAKSGSLSGSQSQKKATVEDNTTLKTKEEFNEQNETGTGSGEKGPSGENTESTENTENGESGTGVDPKSDEVAEGKQGVDSEPSDLSLEDKVLAEAEKQLQELRERSAKLVNEIAEAALSDFKYNESLSLKENMAGLRKAITVVVNGYKKAAKDQIATHFERGDKLAKLLTAAVKGLELLGISSDKSKSITSNENVSQAKKSHDQRNNANVTKNEEANPLSHREKSITKLKGIVDSYNAKEAKETLDEAEIAHKKSTVKKLAKLLGVSEEDAAVHKDESAKTAEPTYSEPESTEDYEHEDPISKQAGESDNVAKEAEEATKPKRNMFSAADAKSETKEKLDKTLADIKSVEKEMSKKFKEAVEIEIKRLAQINGEKHGKAILHYNGINKEARTNVLKEMENC